MRKGPARWPAGLFSGWPGLANGLPARVGLPSGRSLLESVFTHSLTAPQCTSGEPHKEALLIKAHPCLLDFGRPISDVVMALTPKKEES